MGCKTKWTTQMFAGKILDEKKEQLEKAIKYYNAEQQKLNS